jgi:hypothetical protein
LRGFFTQPAKNREEPSFPAVLPPEDIIAAAHWRGVFHLPDEGDVFTLEWPGPVDPMIEAAIPQGAETRGGADMNITIADPCARVDLCDIAPSRFARIDRKGYFTIDADWIVPALCHAVHVEGPILEPCAGAGRLVCELRALGLTVHAADLFAYADSLIPDVAAGVDVFGLKSLADYRFVVTNLPYRVQDTIFAHLLPIAARDGCYVAVLGRSEWGSAKARARSCIIWSPEPRASDRDPFLSFAG